jgi:hypothetical protein
MNSKFLTLVAAGALALSASAAMAQQSGAPSNERDQTNQPTDSSQNSANPDHGGNAGAQPNMDRGGGTTGQGPAMRDRTPLQPGGNSPSAPPQGQSTGGSAFPNPR